MKRVKMLVSNSRSKPGLLSLIARDGESFRSNLVLEGFEAGEKVVIVSESELEDLQKDHDDYKRYYDDYYR